MADFVIEAPVVAVLTFIGEEVVMREVRVPPVTTTDTPCVVATADADEVAINDILAPTCTVAVLVTPPTCEVPYVVPATV